MTFQEFNKKIKNVALRYIKLIWPWSLILPLAPNVIGTAMAFGDGIHHFPSAIILLLGAFVVQIGLNLPHDMRLAKVLCFTAFLPVFGYIIRRVGWWPLGIICLLLFIVLTCHLILKITAKNRFIEEFVSFLFWGPVSVSATYYLQSLEINHAVIFSGFAPGLYALAMLTIHNLWKEKREGETELLSSILNFGENFTLAKYLFFLLCAPLVPIGIFFITKDHVQTLSTAILVIFSIPPILEVIAETNRYHLNRVRRSCFKLLFVYSIIFSWGWICL